MNSHNVRKRLDRQTAHLCVDMQRMFAEETEWRTPWMDRVLPVVESIVKHCPERTIFTRFIPPRTADEAEGAWRGYFQRHHRFTRDEIDAGLLDLVQPLAALVPPATLFDKSVYSPFYDGRLVSRLRERDVETLIITGAETDVCVLAAVMDAMDHGFHVVLPRDALCSGADETHDALMRVYESRFSQQVELTTAREVLRRWTI
ncbi:MAG TPA: cysteine hydrolase [Aurantimonas sp.]